MTGTLDDCERTEEIGIGRPCRQYSDLKYKSLFSFIWAVFQIYLRKLEHIILIFYVLFKILYVRHFYMLFKYFICCSDSVFYTLFKILYAVKIFYMLFKISCAVQNFYMLFRYFICCSKFLCAVQIFYMLIEMQIYFHKL